MKQLSLVMPVYNEDEVIEKVISKWSEALEKLNIDFEIFAYNDGSTDKSLEILNNIAKNNPHLVVKDKKNSGHGATILQGYRDCSENFEWIFQTDSDDELGVDWFEKLWQNRENYSFLIGKRIYKNRNFSRTFISFVAKIIVRTFCGKGISDVNCPYRLMKSDVFRDFFLKIPQDTFAPNVIISSFVNKKHLKYFEIPLIWNERTTGTVSIQKIKLLKSACKAFLQTISLYFKGL